MVFPYIETLCNVKFVRGVMKVLRLSEFHDSCLRGINSQVFSLGGLPNSSLAYSEVQVSLFSWSYSLKERMSDGVKSLR